MVGTVFILSNNENKKDEIKKLCDKFNLKIKEIAASDINTPLGKLLGMDFKNKPKEVAPLFYAPKELMVFNGLSDKDLNTFLLEYEKCKIEPVLYKGVITPFNTKLSPYELILDYEKEQI